MGSTDEDQEAGQYSPGTERLLSDLLAQVGELTQTVKTLSAQNSEIRAENRAIRAENEQIRAAAKQERPATLACGCEGAELGVEVSRLRAVSEEARALADKAMARAEYSAAQADSIYGSLERQSMLRGAFGEPPVDRTIDLREPVRDPRDPDTRIEVLSQSRRTKRWEAYLRYAPDYYTKGPRALPPGSP